MGPAVFCFFFIWEQTKLMKLTIFVGLYLLCTVGIGLYAATRVKSTTDYALAGRSLPLVMVITATFATWFGSESVLGTPGQFITHGLEGIVEEPFGSSMALILVGAFFARRLYKMSLLTVGDFYRRRYGVSVELICSIFVVLSYLGWVAAQVAALGLVMHILTEGFISVSVAMIIGTIVVLLYTVFGGMWSVALTDFFQMIIIVIGLALVAFFASDMAGGVGKVTTYAVDHDLFRFFPENDLKSWMFWISAAITMMIGSIPQQDVFQRVMSAKTVKIACAGPIIGGTFYLLFASIPLFIVVAATVAVPEMAAGLMDSNPQEILPTFIKDHMPLWLRILFFGAVLSAVMSTASATMLAPTTTFVENVLRNIMPLSDKRELKAMRISLIIFAFGVLTYSLCMEGTPIYELAAMAYQFPVIGAFWPLTLGLYWRRSTAFGCWVSIIVGSIVWAYLTFTPTGEDYPALLCGFLAAGIAMVIASLLPLKINRDNVRNWEENKDKYLYDASAAS